MESLGVLDSESRGCPRVSLAQGIVQARLPMPNNWNWFTNVSTVDVINVSQTGLGVACRLPLTGCIDLLFKLKNESSLKLKCIVKHQQVTLDGVYLGIEIIEGNTCNPSLFERCVSNELHPELQLVSH
ncbi:hypothetical protein GCM10011369_10320 [Neiella marina]|uniref:PilZ domain-containing protein n=1 Tax=Neiella marina TaxID=508461 RepID=A0A8J2U395_9GAMM|nr:hypothetical protein [Neiella marina]GGA70544.1 hypothetical protein GCM10011369_10320 [Neiella marina]